MTAWTALDQAERGGARTTNTLASIARGVLSTEAAINAPCSVKAGAAEPIGMPVGMFKTKDGFMSVNARRDEHFKRLAKLLGKDEWITDPRYADARPRNQSR